MITDRTEKELIITKGNRLKAQHIQTLVAIADAGSLRGAAELLNKTQPALTKSLRQAEEDLGVPIFQRSSRGVVPTELGERVLSRARAISSEIGRLDEEVAQLRGEQVGRINVCVSPLAAVKIAPHALAWFHQDHPEIEVHLTSGLFPGALKPLRDGNIDMVIGPSPPAALAREIKLEPLLTTPVVVITSLQSPHRQATCLADLTDAPMDHDWSTTRSRRYIPATVHLRRPYSTASFYHIRFLLWSDVTGTTIGRGLYLSAALAGRCTAGLES